MCSWDFLLDDYGGGRSTKVVFQLKLFEASGTVTSTRGAKACVLRGLAFAELNIREGSCRAYQYRNPRNTVCANIHIDTLYCTIPATYICTCRLAAACQINRQVAAACLEIRRRVTYASPGLRQPAARSRQPPWPPVYLGAEAGAVALGRRPVAANAVLVVEILDEGRMELHPQHVNVE